MTLTVIMLVVIVFKCFGFGNIYISQVVYIVIMRFRNFCIVLLIVVLLSLTAVSAINKDEYSAFNYKEIDKSPTKHINDKVYVSGEVFQIHEDVDGYGFILLSVDGDSSQNVAVFYDKSNDVVEGDTITVYGVVTINYDYESKAGYQLSVPAILADEVEK